VIFGIGTDVVRLDRVQRTLERFGDHFVRRLLLPEELAAFRGQRRPDRFLAMRFAAKEAIVKAMGTGFAHGVWIRDIGVVQNNWGRPEIIYSARGDERRRELGIGQGHVSLTDEAGLVVAIAVLLQADSRVGRP
jgi:holo-[acyl-carrier protein] synthase